MQVFMVQKGGKMVGEGTIPQRIYHNKGKLDS